MLNNQDRQAGDYQPGHRRGNNDDRYIVLRNILNIIFMIGAVTGVIVYFKGSQDVGTIIILASMAVKIVECVFRFMK